MPVFQNGSSLWQLANRFIRFGLVGASGVFVDMGVLFVLSDPKMLGWGLTASKILAAEAAIINNFIWNDIWTFRDISVEQMGWKSRVNRFAKFNLICLAGIGLSVLLLNCQVHFLHMNVYLANFIAIFIASFWNFWMNLHFGWVPLRRSIRSRLNASKATRVSAIPRKKPSW